MSAFVLIFTLGLSAVTVNHTFSATSGNIDDNISFITEKNQASTAPAFNTELRLYYHSSGNGGSVTLQPKNGAVITAVEITASSASYTPTVKYNEDGENDEVATLSATTYTISGLHAATSLRFRNANTENMQLRITSIKVTYDEAPKQTYTVTFNPGSGSTTTSSLTEASVGAGVVLPMATPCVSTWTFDGWSEEEVSETTTLPTLVDMSTGTYFPKANITLYAVYSQRKGVGQLTEYLMGTVGFESSEGFTATTVYNNETAINQGAAGKQWAFVMGTSSTTQPIISGTQTAQMRSYVDNPTMGSVTMLYDNFNVTKVVYKSQYSNGAGSLNLYYSTVDFEKSW